MFDAPRQLREARGHEWLRPNRRKMKSGTALARAPEGLTGKPTGLGVGRGADGNSRDEVSEDLLRKRATSMGSEFEIYRGLTCPRGGRTGCTSPLRRRRVGLVLAYVSKINPAITSCPTYAQRSVQRTARRCRTRVGALPANAERTDRALGSETVGNFDWGSRHARLRGAGSGPRLHVPAGTHRAIGQDHSAASKCQNCAPRSSRAWLNVARSIVQELIGDDARVTNLASELATAARERRPTLYPRRRHTSPKGERRPGVRRVLTDPGSRRRSATALATAPSNSSRIIIAASWSAIRRR